MPDYADAAEKAGWIKRGTRWTHHQFPGKVYGNAREIYNEALPVEFKRPLSADRWEIEKPTVFPTKVTARPKPEWTPADGPHPDTVSRKQKPFNPSAPPEIVDAVEPPKRRPGRPKKVNAGQDGLKRYDV